MDLASKLVRRSDGRYCGIQSTTLGDVYFFCVEDYEILPNRSPMNDRIIAQNPSLPARSSIFHDLILDEAGLPVVAYVDTSNHTLVLARPAGAGGWTRQVLDPDLRVATSGGYPYDSDQESSQPKLATGPDLSLHLVYERYADGTLRYATNDAGSWLFRDLGPGTSPDLAVDDLGLAHIAFVGATAHNLKSARSRSRSAA